MPSKQVTDNLSVGDLLAVRRSVGRALLLRGIHHLRQRGFRRVDLTVDAANTTAIALYLAVGFRQVGSVVSYECRL